MRLHRLALLCLPFVTVPTHAQWNVQDSHTTASLRGIHNVAGGVAWASGTNGTVLRTEDGGYHWQTCAVPLGAEHLDFRGIEAFDENTAIVMSSGRGDLSRLYKTSDDCKTWKLVLANRDKDGFWDAIRFDFRKPLHPLTDWRDHTHGVLVGDPVHGDFVIYETNNSGDTWRRRPNDKSARPAKASANESIFAASNSALITPGVNGPFAFVTGGKGGAHLFIPEAHSPFDNGTTWRFSEIKLPLTSDDSAGAFSMAARFTRYELSPDLMIVGGDYNKPNATEGNAAFIPFRVPAAALVRELLLSRVVKPSSPPHGYRSAVAYDEKTKTWITVGPNGTDISTNDGKNWHALKPKPGQPTDADKNWNALSLPFVVGPNGRIGKLRDDALKP
jgi:photosystem II stability/assembly factor-like uncharacterized protein